MIQNISGLCPLLIFLFINQVGKAADIPAVAPDELVGIDYRQLKLKVADRHPKAPKSRPRGRYFLKGEAYTGLASSFKNGHIETVFTIVDGYQHGKLATYFIPNGPIRQLTLMDRGVEHGRTTHYNEDGSVKQWKSKSIWAS